MSRLLGCPHFSGRFVLKHTLGHFKVSLITLITGVSSLQGLDYRGVLITGVGLQGVGLQGCPHYRGWIRGGHCIITR